MALFDVDKSSDDRGSPMPNTHDVQPNPMSKQTISTSYSTNKTLTSGGRVALLNNQVQVYDTNGNMIAITSTALSVYNNGIEIIRIGLLPDGTEGMVVSKPGIDLKTAFS